MPVSTGRTQICSVQNTLERWRAAKQTPVRHLYPSALQVKTEAIGFKKKKKNDPKKIGLEDAFLNGGKGALLLPAGPSGPLPCLRERGCLCALMAALGCLSHPPSINKIAAVL